MSLPCWPVRSTITGSFTAALSAACSFADTAGGVPAGGEALVEAGGVETEGGGLRLEGIDAQIPLIGEIEPDQVHLPGIYVQRLVLNATPEKRIEHRTVRSA